MEKIKVGVIRGGPSSEYGVSLQTGGEVLRHLPPKYKGVDILLGKKGEWHLDGYQKEPASVFDAVDVIFNATHGEYGEDGRLQQVFEKFKTPYTGSGVLSSALAMRKHFSRELLKKAGIKTPITKIFKKHDFYGLDAEECAKEAFSLFPAPWVTKPAAAGSSLGITVCRSYPQLIEGIKKAEKYGDTILVEEYIQGKEATCGILKDYRGNELYALPVVEVLTPAGKFFDENVKYNGAAQKICPAGFDKSVKSWIEEAAKIAHEDLRCGHYSRADFIVSPKGVYLLEVNTQPGLTSNCPFPTAAEAAGLKLPDLIDHLITLALNKK